MAANHREAVLAAIVDAPGRTRAEISEATGLTVANVGKYLTKLRKDGVIVSSGGQWFPNAEIAKEETPEPLDLCVWKDGSINLKRGGEGMFLDPTEVVQVFEFITRSIPHLSANGLNSELTPESRQLLQRLLPSPAN